MNYNVVFDTKNKVAVIDNMTIISFELIEKLYSAYQDVQGKNVTKLHVKGDK